MLIFILALVSPHTFHEPLNSHVKYEKNNIHVVVGFFATLHIAPLHLMNFHIFLSLLRLLYDYILCLNVPLLLLVQSIHFGIAIEPLANAYYTSVQILVSILS